MAQHLSTWRVLAVLGYIQRWRAAAGGPAPRLRWRARARAAWRASAAATARAPACRPAPAKAQAWEVEGWEAPLGAAGVAERGSWASAATRAVPPFPARPTGSARGAAMCLPAAAADGLLRRRLRARSGCGPAGDKGRRCRGVGGRTARGRYTRQRPPRTRPKIRRARPVLLTFPSATDPCCRIAGCWAHCGAVQEPRGGVTRAKRPGKFSRCRPAPPLSPQAAQAEPKGLTCCGAESARGGAVKLTRPL